MIARLQDTTTGLLRELFIASPQSTPVGPVVTTARRLLVVDALEAETQLTRLLVELEREAVVELALVAAEELDAVPSGERFDGVWLVVTAAADPAYSELLAGELEQRFAVGTTIVCEGERAPAGWCALGVVLGAAALPWRSNRQRRSARLRLTELLECGEAGSA